MSNINEIFQSECFEDIAQPLCYFPESIEAYGRLIQRILDNPEKAFAPFFESIDVYEDFIELNGFKGPSCSNIRQYSVDRKTGWARGNDDLIDYESPVAIIQHTMKYPWAQDILGIFKAALDQ